MNGPDPYGERHHQKEDLVNDIKDAINELSDLKSLNQLKVETARAQQASYEREKRIKVEKYRVEQAEIRMKNIEEEERERCRKTAKILKEFERKSCNGPFFEKLLEILTNYQGIVQCIIL